MNAVLFGAMLFLSAAQTIQAQAPRPGQIAPTPPRDASVSASALLRGRVLNPEGRPLAQAQVRLQAVDSSQPPHMTITDGDGRFELTDLPAGSYRLTASRTGYLTLEFGQRRPFERGQPIFLDAGETRERADIALPRNGAIEGRVLDENGDPVEGASVRVRQVRFVNGRRRLADAGTAVHRTDDLGRYRIYGLRPGQYVVSAVVGQLLSGEETTDLQGYAETYFPGTSTPAGAQVITVGLSEDVLAIDFTLSRVGVASVAGIGFNADGEPIQGGLLLSATQRSGTVAPMPVGAYIKPDGTFEFRNVAPGEYVIQAFKPRVNPWTEGEFGSQFVTISGADVTDILIQTSVGSTITGHVTVEGTAGSLAPDAIELVPFPVDLDLSPLQAGPSVRAEIHDDWTLEMAGIHGPRRLLLRRAPPGWALKSVSLNGTDITDTALSFGTKDESLNGVEIVLTSHITEVTGSVIDERGRLVFNATVIVAAQDRERWYEESRFLKRAALGPDGTFSIRGLPPGDYFVTAIDPTQMTDAAGWQDPEFLESLGSFATKVTLTDGQKLSVSPKLLLIR